MQRSHQAVFLPGYFVFPGGAVDPVDASEDMLPLCGELDDAEVSRMLGLERGGLAYVIAAIRESFEEVGLLLAHDPQGEYVEIAQPGDVAFYAGLRERLTSGQLTLADVCRVRNLSAAVDKLAFFSHWVTPVGPPRRYDTRFFVAAAPERQTATPDGQEAVDHVWIAPAEALERARRGQLALSSPTLRTLKELTAFETTQALITDTRRPRQVRPTLPRFASGRDGKKLFYEGDAPYAEIGKIDPQATATAAYEILPGNLVRISDRVLRLTAPNPGVMTGPGTNTYLVGNTEVAVIDPGPAIDEHVAAIMAAAPGPIRWILTTHTHIDHSPAARLLQARTGAEVLGRPAPEPKQKGHDQAFQPDRQLEHGERLTVDGATLAALYTPGHASNHFCFLLEEEKLLFAGDHIMQGSTVVINPPDGDMGAYLKSLRALHEEEIDYIAPAHGFLMDAPYNVLDRLIAHRMSRESKVMAALRELGSAGEDALVTLVYADVPVVMHPLAKRSLLAHLLKLQRERSAVYEEGQWRLSTLKDNSS
ncbi:MAG: MBL fold metallo-hydrolase [Halomonas sp.]|uniref:MBL fold metallo-hydrolase n=1 Tax=Halomonas sp. TaxID=1486246 RepID=UPI003F8E5F01